MMLKLGLAIKVAIFVFFLCLPTESQANLNGQSCNASAMHKDRMSQLMLDKAPSLLEKCGIGGMFDLCGGFGGLLGDIMDVVCNGIDLDISSNFCGMEFSLDSIDGYYSYKDSSSTPYSEELDLSEEAIASHKVQSLSESLGLIDDYNAELIIK